MSNKSQKKRFLNPSHFGEERVASTSFNSVELIPDLKASAAFTVNSSEVFKESEETAPVIIDKDMSYMPCGADNYLPYRVLDLIESDETLYHTPALQCGSVLRQRSGL